MSDITVTVSGGDGSSSITAGVGDTINVTTSPLAGPLPELQIAAGSGITVDSKNGVSTISANLSELSIPANLADLTDVSAGATSGQVLSYNGTEWGGLTLAIPTNLADLSNVNGTPTAGQVLAWNGTSWAPADDQTGGSSNVANLADLADVSIAAPATGQALVWSGSEWAGGNIPPGTTVNGLSGAVNLVSGDNVAITVDGQNLTIASVGGGDGVTALNGLTGSLTLAAGDGVTIANSGSTITLNATADLTGYATETYVDSAVANLVNGSPAALDTLAELSAALNNESDFAANVTTLISQKADANHDHVKANITDLTTGDLDMQGNRVLFANYYATQNDFPDPAVYHGMVAHSHADGAFYGAHAGAWVRLANQSEIPASTSVNTLTGDITLVAGDNINVTSSGQNITIAGQQAGIVWSTPPQNGSSPGNAGDVAYDNNYLYLRTSEAWRQVPLSPISTNITISQQPSNQSVDDGDTATFTVLATAGGETITYQWKQSSDDGSTFADISGATSNSLTVTSNLTLDGYQYRASLSAPGAADVTSSVATLTVAETFDILAESGDRLMTESGDSIDHDGLVSLTFTTQPQSTTAADGNATFTSLAEMSDGTAVTYQWQELIGGNWTDMAGETSQNLALTGLLTSDDGEQYRVVADGDRVDPVISNVATLATPQFLTIASQPQNTTAVDGNATFTSLAEMSDGTAVAYQWQELISGNWTDIAGETGQNLTLTALVASDDGEQYRVVADGDRVDPVISNVATLTTPQVVSFTTQPQNTTAVDGNATFTSLAETSDGTAVTYQWQELISGNWTDIAGETSQSLALTALVASDDGEQYRVVADGDRADPVTSNVATLSVPVQLEITSQPQNATAAGGEASFAVTATVNDGSALTYQWEEERLLGLGDSWTRRTLPQSSGWNALAFGNGILVAVSGGAGQGSNVAATSTDGINWVEQTLPSTSRWTAIAFGNGVFVAVAYNSNVAATSTDGINWVEQTLPTTAEWRAIAFGNGVFVAVAANSNIAATSTDGATWNQWELPSSQDWGSVAYGSGKFVAIPTVGFNDEFAISTTGSSWSQVTGFLSGQYRDVAYGNNTFVVVGESQFLTSSDGVTWTGHPRLISSALQSVAYGGGRFVAISHNDVAATSSDGINWTQTSMPDSTYWTRPAFDGDKFVAVSLSASLGATSNLESLQFTPLSGETAPTLNLTGLTAADDGERYRVVVDSPSVEPVTSDPATLTVT